MLYRWFTIINWLLGCLFNAQEDFKELQKEYSNSEEYTYLEALAYTLQEKCKQYYKYTDNSAVYYTIQVLLPNKKQEWFQQEFKKNKNKKYQLYNNPKDPENCNI